MAELRVKVTNDAGQTEYGYAPTVFVPVEQWKEKMATLKRDGEQFVQEIRGQRHPFQVRVLGPREAPDDAPQRGEVSLTAVVIEQDWKAQTKLAMVEDANNFLTKAYQIGVLSAGVSQILKTVIEGGEVSLTNK